MDHRKLCGPVLKSQKSKERANENTSQGEEAKVVLADEATAIVSGGQKDQVKRKERFCENLGT